MPEHVSASHIGYLCDARKIAVVHDPQSTTFYVQDMAAFASMEKWISEGP